MKKAVFFILTLALMSVSMSAAIDNQGEIAKLRQKLSHTKSRQDSIKILYDIFDLSSRQDYKTVCRELDGVAARAGNNEVRLDMARQMANVISNDSVLTVIEDHVLKLPESDDQKETKLFVRIRKMVTNARYLSDEKRQEKISNAIARLQKDSVDKYAKVGRLFSICEYLGSLSQGEMLEEYLDNLGEMMHHFNINSYALNNMYYSECANIYTTIGKHDKAVAADRVLLKTIEEMEKKYKAEGRKYKNFDVNRYIIYRRMLSNYKALSLKEVNELYEKVLALTESNIDVKRSVESKQRSAAYHAMKNGNYAEAIACVKDNVEKERSVTVRKQIYEMMLEAANKINDTATAKLATEKLAIIDEEINNSDAQAKLNELKIRYDVSALRAENAELELENKNEQIESTRKIMTFVMVSWLILAVALMAMLFFWTRYRRTTAQITTFVDALTNERDDIKRRRYDDYARRTGLPAAAQSQPGERPKFKNMADMVDYIINDVMFISSVAIDDKRKYVHELSVESFMKDSVDILTATMRKNVNLNVIYPEPDFEIRVDKDCLEMLTNHILQVAVKLAPAGGSVGFECTYDGSLNMARFVFKHSGASLPEGREEKIFENFFDFKTLSDNSEVALTLCRMINFLSSCSLKSGAGSVSSGMLVLMVPIS